MDNIYQLFLSFVLLLALSACDSEDQRLLSSGDMQTQAQTRQTGDVSAAKTIVEKKEANPNKKLPESAFKTIEWTELMPKEDLDALLNPPKYLDEIEDGSMEDQIDSKLKAKAQATAESPTFADEDIGSEIENAVEAAIEERYQQALISTKVVADMDGKPIRLAGFVVPLEYDDEQTITQFFLVPFFGACIHVPPPPPNQIIFVDFPQGFKMEALYDPIWVSGIVKTSLTENKIATASYSLKMQNFEFYTE